MQKRDLLERLFGIENSSDNATAKRLLNMKEIELVAGASNSSDKEGCDTMVPQRIAK